jgi:hypothetical protein
MAAKVPGGLATIQVDASVTLKNPLVWTSTLTSWTNFKTAAPTWLKQVSLYFVGQSNPQLEPAKTMNNWYKNN